MTIWRITREPGFPAPIIIRGRKYYYADELETFEASRRRAKTAATTATTTVA